MTAMLRARTIRHSASAYFQRDFSLARSPDLELPQTQVQSALWSSEVEEKRIRIQRPSVSLVSSSSSSFSMHTPVSSPRWSRKRRALTTLLLFCLCGLSLWVFRNAFNDFSVRIWDIYDFSSPLVSPTSSATSSHPQRSGQRVIVKQRKTLPASPANDVGHPHPLDSRTRRWPPLVTKIPETRPDAAALHAGLTSASLDSQFCGGVSPCRLLLPLWIAEQESRARMHLAQISALARALNRTLVLPNVGRSRVGACARWEFDVYYDVASFVRSGIEGEREGTEEKEGKRIRPVMLMDDFKTWLEMRPVGPEAQVVFMDETVTREEDRDLEYANLFSGDGLLDVHVDLTALASEDPRLKKTKCLDTKYKQLDTRQHMAVTVHAPFPEHQKPLPDGHLLVKSLTRPEISQASFRAPHQTGEGDNTITPHDPDVLVLHWDLRHFPFYLGRGPKSGRGTLDAVTIGEVNTGLAYSSRIHALTQRLVSPHTPFLAVHWRMETVPPALIPDCAEALVDTMTSLLADPTLGRDVKAVWFASDFPWPVSETASARAAMTSAQDDDLGGGIGLELEDGQTMKQSLLEVSVSARRSNTFRSVAHEHVEAIEIVKAAFKNGGPLEGFRLTGVAEELDRVRKDLEREGKLYVLEEDDDEGLLLDDPGVLGILDKLAAMKAALFVSGAKRCGRVSTFTRQITDFRANARGVDAQRNVVEVFG